MVPAFHPLRASWRRAARAGGLALLAATGPAVAAPLDALLTARHEPALFSPQVELAHDRADASVDVLGLRPDSASYNASTYRGAQLALGMRVARPLWLELRLWGRQVEHRQSSLTATSWLMAAQWQWAGAVEGGAAPGLAWAARASVWGNQSPGVIRATTATMRDVSFLSVSESRPRDRQLQFDVVASLPLGPSLEVSAFGSAGWSRVDFDSFSATARMNGCTYDVEFTPTRVIATNPGCTLTRLSLPNEVIGLDVRREAAYRSSYLQIGANAAWRHGPWQLRGGARQVALRRGAIDDIVAARGGNPVRSATTLTGEAAYRFTPGTLAFVRGEVMSNRFVGESPFTYTTLTAGQHRPPDGFLTLGVRLTF